jgi:hypothetical protein
MIAAKEIKQYLRFYVTNTWPHELPLLKLKHIRLKENMAKEKFFIKPR